MVLVEVRDGDGHVTVRKEGDSLRVTVLTGGEHIDVSVPVGTLDRLARKIDRAVARA